MTVSMEAPCFLHFKNRQVFLAHPIQCQLKREWECCGLRSFLWL